MYEDIYASNPHVAKLSNIRHISFAMEKIEAMNFLDQKCMTWNLKMITFKLAKILFKIVLELKTSKTWWGKIFWKHQFKTFLLDYKLYRHAKANPDWPKNMLLIKNPRFLPNHYETHKYLILIRFHNDWEKIVHFLLIAYFWASQDLPLHVWSSSIF